MNTRDLAKAAFAAICMSIVAAATQSCQIISGLDRLDAEGSSSSSSGGGTPCEPGEMQACYSGPPATMGVGVCHGGTQTCEADGSKPCSGEVTPQAVENCADEIDLNCDGAPPLICSGVIQKAYVGGNTGLDAGQAVAVDSKGNAIFVGEYVGMMTFGDTPLDVPPGTGANVFVVKLDPTGAVLWAKSFGGDGYDIGISVAVGKDDTIVLTGMYSNSMTFGGDVLTAKPMGDIFLAKLDPDGNPLWGRSFGGDGADVGHGVVVDAQGTIFLTGYHNAICDFGSTVLPGPFNNQDDAFVAKISPDGVLLWAVGVAGGGFENGYGVTTDSAGDVVVAGRGYGDITIGASKVPGNPENGALLFKIDGDTGDLLWGKIFGPSTMGANQIVYDVARGGGDDDLVIVGHFEKSIDFPPKLPIAGADGLDVFVAKLDKNGNGIWSQAFTGAMNDVAYEVDVDGFGNILVGGAFTVSLELYEQLIQSGGGVDGFAAKFRPDGSLLWAQALHGTGNDGVHGVAIDPGGTSYITGPVDGSVIFNGMPFVSAGAGDAFLVKIAP
ncbi:MAG TPA: hypothetical protein VE093_15420 [Polyangiaceae bacterium]|nr:hypothetical protein [Polyangiaceae bacterium]